MAVSTCLIIAAAWFMGAFLNGITGLGGAMVALPITALLVNWELVIPSSCLTSVCIALFMVLAYCRHANLSELLPLVVGSVPGTVVGVWLLSVASQGMMQLVMGVMILGMVVWQFLGRGSCVRLGEHRAYAGVAGFAGGMAQAATSMGGPPVAMYATLRHWEKNMALGTLGCFYTVGALLTVAMQYAEGLYTPDVYKVSLLGVVGSLLGLALSVPAGKHISQQTFRKLTLALLAFSGLLLLCRALSAYIVG